MAYMSIEVKAWYDIKKDKLEIGQNYINTMINCISNKHLNTNGSYPKPKNKIIAEIQSKYNEFVCEDKVKNKVSKINTKKYADIKEYEVVIGIVYLSEKGKIKHCGHFDDYFVLGPSQRKIREVYGEKI